MLSLVKRIFGTANDRIIKKMRAEIARINQLEPEIAQLSDEQIKQETVKFKELIASGRSLDEIVHRAFAVAREASKRALGLRHFDEQLIGGLILHRGMISEMRTGEGKTLVAVLPAYLHALTGRGVHVVTVNDYLAQRDAAWMGKIYQFLGLTVGCIRAGLDDEERKAAYNADITYATNNELGFDYLRDNMKFSLSAKVQRPFSFAIIDEVDSILIDEARTPLIISGPVDDNSALYTTIDRLVRNINAEYYEKDEKTRSVNLNEAGISYIEELLIKDNLIKEETSLYDFENMYLVHFINQALRAHTLFARDVDYLVKDNKVVIIDEFTGRMMDGRRYSEGLHQALEAKERVPIQNENQTLASITFQNYFRMYPSLSGMTGTAMTEAAELKDIYNLEVVSVPTHNAVKRIDHDDIIYGSTKDKYNSIIKLIQECYAKGQPVLVGTISIEKSEEISRLLTAENIKHKVLNAKYHAQEAHIIAQAGRYKAVTIATNMAGRGTDIMLGGNPEMLISELAKEQLSEEAYLAKIAEINAIVQEEKQRVLEAGGLMIIGTERHESRRIDNQLRGRAGRQGDPGSTQFFLSLEDDLMRIFASDRIAGLLRTLGLKDGEAIHHPMISKSLEKAQQKVEGNNYEIRKNLLRFDNVMNDQRKVIYKQREEILESEEFDEIIENFASDNIGSNVINYIHPKSYREDWDITGLKQYITKTFSIELDDEIFTGNVTKVEIGERIISAVMEFYRAKQENYGKDIFNQVTKHILISTLDQCWKEHLHALDHLRQGISLRAYGQKDPLNEYKKEAFGLFEVMLDTVSEQFIERVSHFHIDLSQVDKNALPVENRKLQHMHATRNDPAFNNYNAGSAIEAQIKPLVKKVAVEDRVASDPSTWGKIARNELCPCGSGKKYKHCHGDMRA